MERLPLGDTLYSSIYFRDCTLGFRVFKLDSTNILEWDPDRDKIAETLEASIEHLKTDRTEQDILDLEREAFLSLCGNPQTQARIQHMLEKGKPLRN